MKGNFYSTFPAAVYTVLLGFLFMSVSVQAQVSPAEGCHWLSFDGTDDYVSVAHNTTLSPGTNTFAVAGWFRAGNTPAASRILIAKRAMGDGAGNPGFALFLTVTGELRAIMEDGSNPVLSAQTAATYGDNTWRHVAVNFIRSGGNFEILIYVNGALAASVAPAIMGSPNNTLELTLGASLNGMSALQFPLDGDLDDFAMWRRPLTLVEIGDLYNGVVTPGQLTSMLRGYWPFEEGTGTTTADAGPNNNTGTLIDGPTWESKTPIPTVSISAPLTTACEGVGLQFFGSANNAATFQWYAEVVGMSPPGFSATFTPSATSPAPVTLTVTGLDNAPVDVEVYQEVTNASGCTVASNVITVTINPNPATAVISGAVLACANSTETYSVPANPGSSYTWNPVVPGGNASISPSGNEADITWGSTVGGPYTVSVTETNANGCSATSTLNVTVQQTPMVNVLPNQSPVCPGDMVPEVNLTSSPAGASFVWTVTGAMTGATPGMGSTIPAFAALNPDATARVSTTEVIAIDPNGCESAPETFTVTVNPSPSLVIDPADEPIICAGDDYNLADVVNVVTDLNDPLAGQFTFHTAPPPGNQIVNLNVAPAATTTYYVLKTTTNGGCTDFTPFDLTVQGPLSINSIEFKDNQPINCEGVTTHIDIDVDNSGDGTLIYLWQVNDGNGWVDIVSGNINTPYTIQLSGARLRINSPALSIDGYDYRCIVSTSECPAITSAELTITVNPLPTIMTITETPVTCNGGNNGSVLFILNAGSGYEYYLNPGSSFSGPAVWEPASVPFNIEGDLTAGDYNLRLRDSVTLCFIDQLITITEPDAITFTTLEQDASCFGGSDGSITVTAMGGNASPYSYRLNGGAPQSSNVFSGLTAGTYDVEVLDGFDPSCIAGPQTVSIGEPTALEVDPVIMDLSCFEAANGMIEPMATGGTSPYSYDWSGPNGYSNSFNGTVYTNNFDTNLNDFLDNGSDFVDVDPMLTNGSVVNEYWSQNSVSDRAITFFKLAQANVVYWEVELTNTTGQEITDLSIQYDFEVPWIANNTAARSARLSWEVVGAGSPVLSSIISNSTTAPTSTWLTDAEMDAFSLALRNQVTTLTGLSIAPGATFTVRVSGATDIGGRRDMNHGVDNLTISSGNFSGKISDLEAGDYELTLSDAQGCVLDSTITVTQPDELNFDLEPAPHICIDDLEFMLPYSAVGGLTNRYRVQNDPAFAGMDAGDLDLTTTGYLVLGASPLTISLNSAPPASGFYHLLITPRSNVGGVICTGEPIAFTVYVPAPNSNPTAQELTICSGASAVIDVTTTELEVASGLRWAYQVGAGPVSPVSFETFDANGDVQISQLLTNNTMAPVAVTFFFRAYTFGPDGIDDNGEIGTDDCREDPGTSVVITVLPEPAGSATAMVLNDPICSGSDVVIDVNTTILASSSYFWVADGVAGSNTVGATMVDFNDNIVEPLANNTNDYLTATYTITPYTWGPNGVDDGGTGDDCLGDPVVVTVDVEPVPNASANLQTPEICSGEQAIIDVTTTSLITNTRYRWRSYPAGSPSGGFNNNNLFGTEINQVLTNTTGASQTITFEIRPYSFGPNGNNNNGGNDDCAGTTVFVDVIVHPEPTLTLPAFVRVCSDGALNFDLPSTDINGVPIVGYDIVSKTVDPDLDVITEAAVPQTMVSFDYISGDTYKNLQTAFRDVTYTVIPYTDENCSGDSVVYTFRIIREPRVLGSTDPVNPTIISVCSGEAIDTDMVGYFGMPAGPISPDPNVTFNVELLNPFNLSLASSNTYPATCLNSSGISGDVFQNFTNNVLFVLYAITPVTNCTNADICEGQTVYFQVEVEPTPLAALSLNLNGNVSPVVDNDAFTACSESSFEITGTSSTNPSDPTHEVWAQVEVSGDIESLGFPSSPNPVTIHGPLDNLNLGTSSLINTTSDPVVINFTIIPYIETTPSIDPIANPQELDQGECAGQPINFTITINPEPDHNDETVAVCSDEALDVVLVPINNTAPGTQIVNEFIEFDAPGMMESWEVPDGVDDIVIEVWGADGGNGDQPGGSGAYAKKTLVGVSQGELFNAYAGAVGQNGTTGGGGGGSAITDDLGNLIIVAAGGGGGALALGGGGQGDVASNIGGDGGASNGGGGGGGFTVAGMDGIGGSGGFGGDAGLNAAGGAGFSTGGNGGSGTGGGGGGSLLAGGGGGGYDGGNGGDGSFQLGGYGGSSFMDNLMAGDVITPGTNGLGSGQNGRIRISWTRELPPITYTITDIDNPAGLADGDGVDRSVAPNNVGVADVMTGESDLIAAEQWINNTNDAQTVIYTIVPENDTECGGDPFTVTVTVDPVPTATVTSDAPMDMVCSGEDIVINVNSPLLAPGAFRWNRIVDNNPAGPTTFNVGFGNGAIQDNYINTTGTDVVLTYQIRPYTYGANGVNNNGSGDDCLGDLYTIEITVKSGPVMPTPANPVAIVCSDEPFGSSFIPGMDINSLPIGSINLLDIVADPGLTYSGTPALPTLPANGLSLNDLNGHSWNNLNTGGLFVTYRIQHVTADGCADAFVDYIVQIRSEPVLASGLGATICSGDATGITLANDPGLGFQSIAGYDLISIDFDGSFLTPGMGNAVPGNNLPANAIEMDTWTNSSDTGLPVTYLIAPRAAAPNGCVGDAVQVIVNVEPTPTAEVEVTVGDDPAVIVDNSNSPQAFEICSDATNFTLIASSTTIPSDPNHELWGRLRILGDVEIFDPMAMGTITLFGPIGNLAIASQPLINTSNVPKTITVQILPYIETTPGVGSPTYNAATECAGPQIEFTITVHPEPDFDDLEVQRCNEDTFDENLDTLANNLGIGANVEVPVEVQFAYTGTIQEWIVPEGVTSVTVTAVGADGGNSNFFTGGSGASATRTRTVTPGDTLYIVVGEAGETGIAGAGGGGGTGVEQGGNIILVAGGGGGAGRFTNGGGGGGHTTNTTGGTAGLPNGGGGGGGWLSAGASSGGQGGQPGFGANGGNFVLAGGWGVAGGGGGYESGTNFGAGGGGGGYRGGNGGQQTGSASVGGFSFRGTTAPVGSVTPGAAGAGQGANGSVILNFMQTVPEISYTIVDINVPAGLNDADGDVLATGDSGDGTLLESEAWTNTTNEFQTVTYTLSPVAASTLSVDGCPGENFEVQMIVEPTPLMELGNVTTISQYETYELTICSGDTLNVPLSSPTVPSGGISTLEYRLLSVTLNGVTGPSLLTPSSLGDASQNVTLNETWLNTGSGTGMVTYVLRPVINTSNGNCSAGDVTFTVTVLPEPVVATPAIVEVCSDSPLGSVFAGFPTMANVPFSGYEVIDVVVGAGITTVSGPTMGMNADVSMDQYRNLTSTNNLLVTYTVIFFSDGPGCESNPVDFEFRVVREARVSVPAPEAVCSDESLTTSLIGYYGPNVPMNHDVNVAFRITYDNPAGLPYTGSNSYDANNTITCVNDGALNNDSWTNTTGIAQEVTYTIVPVRACNSAFECDGEAVTFTATIEPEVTFDLTLTHSGVPAGPQTINVNNAPPASPLALTICADSPFEATIAAAAVPSANADAMVRVFVADPDGLTGLAGTTNLLQSDLEAFLSFPTGIQNPGTMPSTIEFRLRPYFDTNGNGDYDAGIDCDLGAFGYDLTVESAVAAQVAVINNPAPVNEVCDDESFTIRLRKTATSVPVAEYLVWVEVGNDLTQTSAAPISPNPMNPTVFDMPGGLPNNQVTFNASFSNASTSNQTVTYHIVPVSATGCLGVEVTQVVTIYGSIEAEPDPIGVCLGSTGTIFSNVVGGGGGYTYTWTYQGGTARQFRINNQLFGNNPAPGTPLNSQTADLLLNANIQVGGILITLPGTILMDLVVLDANGCSETFSFEFLIEESPESGTTVPFVPTVCENGPIVDLFDLLTLGSYDTGGTWSQTGGPAEGILDPVNGTYDPVNITGLTPKIFMFTYTVDNGFCPPVSTEVTLSVQPDPQAGAYVGSPAYVCVGTSTYNLFNLLVPGSFEAGGTWSQTFGPTAIPILPNGDAFVSIGTPGNYTFRYAFAPVGICDGSEVFVDLVIETEANAGMVDPMAINEFCTGQNIDLFTLITGNQPGGVWSEITSSGGTLNAVNGEFDPSNAATGSYSFQYLVVGQAPCTGADSVQVTIEIQETPDLTVTLDLDGVLSATVVAANSPVSRTICSGTEITLNATSSAMPMSGAEVWYAADIIDPENMLGGLIPEFGPLSLFTDLMQTLTNNSGGPQNLFITLTPYIETDPNGPVPQLDPNECSGESISLLITVQETPEGDDLELVLCDGNPLLVNLNDQINNNVFSTFEWSADDNPDVSGESTTTQTTAVIADVLVNNSNLPQLVVYTVTPISNDGCEGEPFTVEVMLEKAYFTYTVDPDGFTYNFEDASFSGSAWSWDFGDGNTSTAQNPTHTFAAIGTYNVCLEVNTDCGVLQYCEMIEVQADVCDLINLNAGLNLISTDVDPADPSITTVFADLIAANNLVFIQGRNSAGAVVIFDPALPPFLNTLTEITPGHGYFVRVQNTDVLEICGAPIDPTFKKDLNAGINLVAYVPQASSTPEDYFVDLLATSNLIFARGYDLGFKIFDPALPPFLNTLTSVDNGFGYEIRVATAVTGMDWIVEDDLANRDAEDQDPQVQSIHYDVVAGISNLSDELVGEQVYLETESGVLLGSMDILPGGYLMTTPVYGFDASVEGSLDLQPGDRVLFRFGTQVVDAGVVYYGDKRIRLVEVNFNETALSTAAPEMLLDMFRVFPNPFVDGFSLNYRLQQDASVSIRLVNTNGQLIDLIQQDMQQPAGNYELRWNGKHRLSSGMYFVQIFVDGKPAANLPVIRQD